MNEPLKFNVDHRKDDVDGVNGNKDEGTIANVMSSFSCTTWQIDNSLYCRKYIYICIYWKRPEKRGTLASSFASHLR